jgi:hypothetical protein
VRRLKRASCRRLSSCRSEAMKPSRYDSPFDPIKVVGPTLADLSLACLQRSRGSILRSTLRTICSFLRKAMRIRSRNDTGGKMSDRRTALFMATSDQAVAINPDALQCMAFARP